MKSTVLTILSVALLAAATGCTNKGSVIGSVSIEEDSRPVREARVVMTPVDSNKQYSTTADWGGNYAIHVKEGDYRISAQHPGLELCNNGNTIVEVRGNKTATVNLCLAKIRPDQPAAAVAPVAPAAPADPATPAADDTQPAASSQTVEVTPIPATEAVPAAAPTTPSQFPPSAAPTFPPASVTTSQNN